jgi:heptaprenyl diphosphate synthase
MTRRADALSSTTLGLPFADLLLEQRVRTRLEEVEAGRAAAVSSDAPFVAEAARHLLDAGGKRFRPLLVLLAAELGDPDADGVVPAALVVELTHLATLYHDDVMDEAALRRGAQSANARWDNTIAILTGDYLFAQASEVVSHLGTDAVRLQAQTFSRLVQGQIAETLGPGDSDPLEHYLQVVADKTGSLIATSALFGARTSGAAVVLHPALAAFGEQIGMAFQLSDDVIDVVSDSDASGKTPGTDLREGIATLPVLLARRSDDPSTDELLALLDDDLSGDDALAAALGALRKHPSVDEAREVVRQRVDRARAALDPLPDGPARAALEALCDLVVTRTG